MAPKRRPRVSSKCESLPAFEKELHRIFFLLKSIAGATETGSEDKLYATEFAKVQGLLLSSPYSRGVSGSGLAVAKHQRSLRADKMSGPHATNSTVPNDAINYLCLLVETDFLGVDKDASGALPFSVFADWQRQVLQSAVRSYADRKQLIVDGMGELEKLELRSSKVAALERAETASALHQTIKESELVIGSSDPVMVIHRERLAVLQTPFMLTLSTFSGMQYEVEVTRIQTVGMLRNTAGRLFEKKPYRLVFAVASTRLEPDSATLEACGITSSVDIGVAIVEENPWREMPISMLLEETVKLDVCSKQRKEGLSRDLENGSLNEEDLVAAYSPKLQAAKDFEAATEAFDIFRLGSEQLIARLKVMPSESSNLRAEASMAYAAHIDQLRSAMAASEDSCSQIAKSLTETKRDAQALLDRALPWGACLADLDALCKSDLSELKGFAKPPQSIMEVLKAVCQLFQVAPRAKSGRLEDYWESAKKELLSDCRFLQKLVEYDKDNIDGMVIRRLDAFITNDQSQPDNVRRVSIAAAALSKWVHAIHTYHHVKNEFEPQRFMLHVNERQLSLAMRRLEVEKSTLGVLLEDSKMLVDCGQ